MDDIKAKKDVFSNKRSKSSFVILNGFDRSGSSAISKTLAIHPQVELIMQPFNSGFIREYMYMPIEISKNVGIAHRFFDALKENYLDNSLIKSHWHTKFSSTQKYKPGKLHLIKTTINHFAQRWMLQNYDDIDVWGIWRNPIDIFESIKRNNFDTDWYSDALLELAPTIVAEPVLKEFKGFLDGDLTPNQELALLISARSYYFFYFLKPEHIISYELFREDPNAALKRFVKKTAIGEYSFEKYAKQDHNIAGQPYTSEKPLLDSEVVSEITPIFAPLLNLHKQKFST